MRVMVELPGQEPKEAKWQEIGRHVGSEHVKSLGGAAAIFNQLQDGKAFWIPGVARIWGEPDWVNNTSWSFDEIVEKFRLLGRFEQSSRGRIVELYDFGSPSQVLYVGAPKQPRYTGLIVREPRALFKRQLEQGDWSDA